MLKNKKVRIAFASISIVALLTGLLTLIWCIIYDTHHWSYRMIFHKNWYIEDKLGVLCVTLGGLIVFWILCHLLSKKNARKIFKVLSYVSFGLYNISAIATIAVVGYLSIDFCRDYKDYNLDCQLSSEDAVKVHEAVDSVIARVSWNDIYREYNEPESPNDYIMKAARNGYAPAQNYIGCWFHGKAKEINNRKYGSGKWSNNNSYYCEEELTRATYWWLRAAKQNHETAQENLGRMRMNDILSSQPYDFEEAKRWLTKAANNGKISAYYYLGELYQDSIISESVRYWRIGAKKGNENCKRMLENPDFIDIP